MKQHIILILTLVSLLVQPSWSQKANDQESKSGWERSDPKAEGIPEAVLNSLHLDIRNGKYGLIDQLLVVKNGKLVFDEFYPQDYETIARQYDRVAHQYNYDHPEWHPYYRNTRLHTLQSVTKSVTSLLLGIAMDEGLMPALDAPVMPQFSGYEFDRTDSLKNAVTLRNLLTMQSGIEWDEQSYDNDTNDCIVMEMCDDWVSYVLQKPMDRAPGTQFEYNSGVSVLLGKLVWIGTGKRIDEWAEEKLFGPLGITEYYWKETPKGEIDTEGGLYLTNQDLAKIGWLMIQEGKWKGEQIVSKEWVQQSFQPSVRFSERHGYGFQWWVPEYRESEVQIYAGNGYGGQFLMLVPKKELIVLFNGWNIHGPTKRSSWTALQERILPYLED